MAETRRHTESTSARIYPCDLCGLKRSKAEGGTTFTVCDSCWDALRFVEKCCPDVTVELQRQAARKVSKHMQSVWRAYRKAHRSDSQETSR
jgi:hypothetical protein